MNATTTYPNGTRSDGGRLQVGHIDQLTADATDQHRDSGWSAPPPPPPRPPGRDRGRGDDDKPSRLERVARRLLLAADMLLAIALVILLAERHRHR